MTRNEKLLRHSNRAGKGLEIGASYSPVAPKREGFNVSVLDRLDRAGLRERYKNEKVNLDAIEEVDFVWRGESYAELVGPGQRFDWIIASHLIEHTPDLIAFLNGCADVLAPGGVLSLAIPDKRFCFDHFRPISGIGSVIDKYAAGTKGHTPGTIAEFMLNAVGLDGAITWTKGASGRWDFKCPLADAQNLLREALRSQRDIDLHAWCFTPSSFRLMIRDLNELGLIRLKELSFLPTEGFEFFVALGEGGALPGANRLELLEEIERELS